MESFIKIITEPWPWYISGPLLGLIVPLLLIIGNKQLGISSVFCHFNAVIGLKKIPLFNYDWREHIWSFLFVFGLILSGFITSFIIQVDYGNLSASAISYFESKGIAIEQAYPENIFIINNLKLIILLSIGGFAIGFGSRYANGCTAGHAIMGLSLLSKGSLVAVIGFFIGGIIGTYLIIDNLL